MMGRIKWFCSTDIVGEPKCPLYQKFRLSHRILQTVPKPFNPSCTVSNKVPTAERGTEVEKGGGREAITNRGLQLPTY